MYLAMYMNVVSFFETYLILYRLRNIYYLAKEVIKGIKWSEELDKTFRNNYKEDPTMSWQYFGSSTGFMRQFPGMSLRFLIFVCRVMTT